MHSKYLLANFNKITRQRNLFLIITIALLASNIFLSLKLISTKNKIIMIPSIPQEMSIEGNNLSPSYLEETSLLFLSNLLNLTTEDIEHKSNLVLKYSSHSSKEELQAIRDYFAAVAIKHKKFNLSTYFTPKEIIPNPKTLQVIAKGILTSRFGREGYSTRPATYLLSFSSVAGQLRLKGFIEIEDEEQKTNKIIQNDK